jgi:GWxTD domain-containing protein
MIFTKKIYVSLVWFSTLLIFVSCATTSNVNNNIAAVYNKNLKIVNPNYKVFHHTDNQSYLYVSLPSTHVLYQKKNTDTTYAAHLTLHYEIINVLTPKIISDSSTIHIVDYNPDFTDKILYAKIPLPLLQGNNYQLHLVLTDDNRSQSIDKEIFVNKSNRNAEEYYLIKNSDDEIIFNPYVKTNDTLYIYYSDTSLSQLTTKIYTTNFPPAAPPFADNDEIKNLEMSFHPDTIFTLYKTENYFLLVPQKGIYHIQQNPKNALGLNLYQFTDSYPEVTDLETMIQALRYITSKKEFESIAYSKTPRENFENFWLSLGGNKERAKQLIRAYYSRVEYANTLFGSYKEGWKTDRGMIYIVYGQPNVVYKSEEGESWIYGEEDNLLSINFVYYKVNNPLTDNDLRLRRSTTYKTSWYRMVDIWRQGRVY